VVERGWFVRQNVRIDKIDLINPEILSMI
jgi:hypothetical protein